VGCSEVNNVDVTLSLFNDTVYSESEFSALSARSILRWRQQLVFRGDKLTMEYRCLLSLELS
jgi:hypothetical protein